MPDPSHGKASGFYTEPQFAAYAGNVYNPNTNGSTSGYVNPPVTSLPPSTQLQLASAHSLPGGLSYIDLGLVAAAIVTIILILVFVMK